MEITLEMVIGFTVFTVVAIACMIYGIKHPDDISVEAYEIDLFSDDD